VIYILIIIWGYIYTYWRETNHSPNKNKTNSKTHWKKTNHSPNKATWNNLSEVLNEINPLKKIILNKKLHVNSPKKGDDFKLEPFHSLKIHCLSPCLSYLCSNKLVNSFSQHKIILLNRLPYSSQFNPSNKLGNKKEIRKIK